MLLPLCESHSCTLKEAAIFGSVMATKSIPPMHACAALLKIAEMPYSGTNSIFIRVLLNKKYALPYRVIDQMTEHFMAFVDDRRRMPVVWQKSLLVFAQRYKCDITAAQKEQLRLLLRRQYHHLITDEVRRELFSGPSRGEKNKAAARSAASMDTSG